MRLPFEIDPQIMGGRIWEVQLLNPLVGSSMLELGNKVKGDLIYKQLFESLGFRHVSVDMNGKDGALPKDLRQPLKLGTFDMVTNFGTSEHVAPGDAAGQAACWRNICEAMHMDSVLVSITPKPHALRWKTHGCWYPTAKFFAQLASLNGMDLERCYTDEHLVYARLKRIAERPFAMPTGGMFENTTWRQSSDNIC